MPTAIIDGKEITIADGERLNAIEAAARAGIEVPHYCWHPALSVVGSCRMCLVETGTTDAESGDVSMMPKLVPACNTPVRDGTIVVTNSEKVQQARAMVEESLLLNHPVDCPICDKAGECSLQDYHFKYGREERRADIAPYSSRRRDLGDVTLFVDRCIRCSRCVRFTREISGTKELMFTARGSHEEIDVVEGFPLENNLSGNVVDLCPVGALGDKDFLYKQRVWFMQRHPGVCAGCATGCSIWVEENQDRIHRIKPRENREVNGWWMCNEGRYGYPHVHNPDRLTGVRRREDESVRDVDWSDAPAELEGALREAGHLAMVVSPHQTVEGAYLLCKLARSIDPKALLVLGPIPTRGEDESFPNGFTISTEKCPNRCGVEQVIRHFAKTLTPFDEFADDLAVQGIRGVWIAGGYREDWVERTTAQRFADLDLLVVQDLFSSPLSELATYVLGGPAFAERDGSYVNRDERLQSADWAIRPPWEVRADGSLVWEMLGREGLYDAGAVLREVAEEVEYFRPAGETPVPENGISLKS